MEDKDNHTHTPMDASVASWLSDFEIDDHTLFPEECPHLNLLVVDDKEFLSHDDIASHVLQEQTLQQSLSSDCTSITLSNSFTDETSFDFADTPSITDNFSPELSPSSSISSFQSQILFFDNINSSPANNITTQFSGFDSNTLNPKQNGTVLVPLPLPQLGNPHISTQNPKGSSKNQNFETKSSHGKRSAAHQHDHIMAERKRREKLSQSFIALAALVPGLKKIDKSSVLTDAITYLKELKERLAVLEEQSKKAKVESAVLVPMNKPAPELCGGDNDGSSSCEESVEADESQVQVEARVSEQDMLIRIHCKKRKRLLTKILAEIQSFQLCVVNSSVLPFGDSIDVTIIAQMGEGYDLTAKELVKKLRVAIL